MLFPCRKISYIKITVWINLYSLSIFLIFFILSFIDFTFSRNTDSCSLPFPIFNKSEKYFALVFHKFKIEMCKKVLKCKILLWKQLVIRKVIYELCLRHQPNILNRTQLLHRLNTQNFETEPTLLQTQLAGFTHKGKRELLSLTAFLSLHNKIN